jgi:serine/threonine protein kinase
MKKIKIKIKRNKMDTDSFDRRYDIIRVLGTGGFGKVYLVRSKTSGTEVAVKVIPVTQKNQKQVIQEVLAFRRLSIPNCSPYVGCYYDSFIDPVRNTVNIEMEYIKGPDVMVYTQPFRDTENTPLILLSGRRLLHAMLLALQYVHGHGIIHNDIKPNNIVVNSDKIPVLVDFGISCFGKDPHYYPPCQAQYGYPVSPCCEEKAGTIFYAPPEILMNVRYPESDLWSLGATIYAIITGDNIWSMRLDPNTSWGQGWERIINNFKTGVQPNKLYTGDSALDTIVNSFLSYDIRNRMSVDEALRMLQQ